jgi:repressor LexA
MYLTRRQREIYEFLTKHIEAFGYAPSLEEICAHFGLSSPATAHKHLTRLQEKGLIQREWNRGRAIEIVPLRTETLGAELPLLGIVAAGEPIEAVETRETISVPADLVRGENNYVLRVRGDSMIDEGIRDGDFVIVEERHTAANGETVIALVGGTEATVKKFYRENGTVRLVPANSQMEPIVVRGNELTIQGVVIGLIRKY